MTKILIVEDQPLVAKNLQTRLKDLGYDVMGWFASGEAALTYVTGVRPDLVLMDIAGRRPGWTASGARTLRKIRYPGGLPQVTRGRIDLKRSKATHPFGFRPKRCDYANPISMDRPERWKK